MVERVTIALDAMGGDAGPSVVVPAALAFSARHPNLKLLLVGKRETIQSHFHTDTKLEIIDASEIVGMDEIPGDALRKKKDSSLRVCVNLVKEGRADACVSAGNTGALMATARFVLKTLPGIDRPAIMAIVPTIEDHAHMLDLGANSDCNAKNLFQFAIMGSVVASEVENISSPRVGLLNIGEEDIKGNDTIREAANLLSNSSLNYIGFIEGDSISKQKADVIVADGFSGNVALKTMEGTANLLINYLKDAFRSNFYSRVVGALAAPVFNSLSEQVDPRVYNGAVLVGLNGIVVKSHGGADQLAFERAIQTAMVEVEKSVPKKIHQFLLEMEQ
ncbi:MAG: phosphate acyltransferase PlsX [Pseudomonadota bacterium]|nr:phosphate acyltransferase PlsX [Pseudomonadota bacterium]